jgi:hypothetical protein
MQLDIGCEDNDGEDKDHDSGDGDISFWYHLYITFRFYCHYSDMYHIRIALYMTYTTSLYSTCTLSISLASS